MVLGQIQKSIIDLLKQHPAGVFIGSTTKAEQLRGYDLSQVERALQRLLNRKIIRKEGVSVILN